MKSFLQTRAQSFRYALSGWWFVIRTQRNAWIHAVVSAGVMVLSFWLQIPARDWAVIVLAIAMVWTAEFLNTALEAVVDLASPQQHYLAKVGKDVGAAAVLIAATSSVVIGLLILGPPLWQRLQWIGNIISLRSEISPPSAPMSTPYIIATAMTANLVENLVEVNSCLRVRNVEDNIDYALAWPPDFSITTENNQVRVISGIETGNRREVVLSIGEMIQVSGGETKQLSGQTLQKLPPN